MKQDGLGLSWHPYVKSTRHCVGSVLRAGRQSDLRSLCEHHGTCRMAGGMTAGDTERGPEPDRFFSHKKAREVHFSEYHLLNRR